LIKMSGKYSPVGLRYFSHMLAGPDLILDKELFSSIMT